MVFSGKIDVQVPASKAWDFLIDINQFSSCLPGLEKVTQLDERTFDGVIGATVGPISGKFSFRATIVESTPPTVAAAPFPVSLKPPPGPRTELTIPAFRNL